MGCAGACAASMACAGDVRGGVCCVDRLSKKSRIGYLVAQPHIDAVRSPFPTTVQGMASQQASGPSRGRHRWRFMCVRCGQLVSGDGSDQLVDKLRGHFADEWRPAASGCRRVAERHRNVVIAHWDHGLVDCLYTCQRQLDRAQREASGHRNATARAVVTACEELRAQLQAANDKSDQLSIEKRRAERRLQEALSSKPPTLIGGDVLAAIAKSSKARKRKLLALLHPDGLAADLVDSARLAREALQL